MAIIRRLGLFSDDLLSRRGAKEALVETIRSTSSRQVGNPIGAMSTNYYVRNKAGFAFQPIPLIPGTPVDMGVFLRAAYPETPVDMSVEITIVTLPLSNFRAYILGLASGTSDMVASIRSWHSVSADAHAYIIGTTSSHTNLHEYDFTILSTPTGVSILRRFLTSTPDLYATIAGWEYLDLNASLNVVSRSPFDLYAFISTIAAVSSDLTATIGTRHIEDVLAELIPVLPSDLQAYLESVEGYDVVASLHPIPGVDLIAFGGGHYPEDLYASLIPSPPKDLSAMLRAGLSGMSDVTAEITARGYYSHLPAFVRGFLVDSVKLKASIIARVPSDIIAHIHGRAHEDITAYIKGVNELNMLCRIVAWAREVETDMVGFIRASWADVISMPVYIHGVISTHTSDKQINFHKLTRPFNSFLVGVRGGISFVTIEPIWGNFPDLIASITGNPLSTNDMRAFIRPAARNYLDMAASVTSVTKSITINKIPINFVNVSDLSVYITAFSGYNPLNAFISGWKSVSTATETGSGWVYVSSTIKFYLGTDKGLFVPSNIVRAIRPDRFVNYSLIPDLWGYIHGWGGSDLSASIAVQPFGSISASLVGQDLSHVSAFPAYIGVMHTSGLQASVTAYGGFTSMSASITPDGLVSDLGASIRPYLKVLGYRIVPVETKPLSDLRAVLNPIASCGYVTTYGQLNAFIRGNIKPPGGLDLTAYLNVLSNIDDLTADIIGRKITRMKLINLMFRAQTRSSASMGGVIVGDAWSTNDMLASIVPLHHTSDLTATVTSYYPQTTYKKHDTSHTIDVYKMVNQNAELHKQLAMAFDTKVESYIYDTIQNSLYTIGDGKWVLNFSELSDTGLFFDKNTEDKTLLLDNIAEYDSVDEAIRAAVVWLTEPQSFDMTATITAVGGFSDLPVTIEGLYADRVNDLVSSLYIVNNEPSLSAYISAYSGYGVMKAHVNARGSGSPGLSASISGVVYTGLSANINGVT